MNGDRPPTPRMRRLARALAFALAICLFVAAILLIVDGGR